MRKIFTSLLIFVSLSFLVFPPSASAIVLTVKKGTVVVASDEVINDDLFIAGETVEIYGTVNGDVYAGAETVRVDGKINGDLHVGAGMVFLSGTVTQDAYIGAGNVTVSSAVIGDSLLIGAGNVNIDKNSTIGGSVLTGSGNIAIYSPVKRNVFAGAGSVDLNASVGGEVRLGAGAISLGPDTKIAKDLYYTVGEDQKSVNISNTATISGKIQKFEHRFAGKQDITVAKTGLVSAARTINHVFTIISLLGAFIVGALGVRFFGKTFTLPAASLSGAFFPSLVTGFLICLATAPVLLALAFTGVGLPLAGLALMFFLINAYLAKIIVGLSLGNWLGGKLGWKSPSAYATLALGLLAVYLLKAIPFFGFLVSLTVLWSGLGALALYYKSTFSPRTPAKT